MKTKPHLIFSALLAALPAFFFVSCSKDQVPPEREEIVSSRSSSANTTESSQAYFVSEKMATELARRLNFSGQLYLPDEQQPVRDIESVFPVADASGITTMYIVNYKSDGFAVLSADLRFTPVCAYVEKGKYEKIAVPSGLVDWFETTSGLIGALRTESTAVSQSVIMPWETALKQAGLEPLLQSTNCCPICPNYPDCLKDSSLGCGDPDIWCNQGGDGSAGNESDDVNDPCGPMSTLVKGPLMTTTWGQSCTYNENCPPLGCQACYSNNRAYTGCVATAIAQVLRYWEHPNQYLYQYYSMPNHQGDREVQRMMRDVGNSVSMHYGCTGSGATGSSIPRSFTSTFAFGNASRKSYQPADYVTILANIDQEKPLILDGCQTVYKVFGFFTTFDKCHAWVCDGYQINRNKCVNNLKLHMNWGWDGIYNGWFHYQTWSGPGVGYPYNQNMTYNIAP